MADRTIKPDDTNDLVLQNNDGSAKIEVNEAQTVVLTGGSTTALTVDTSGNTTIAGDLKVTNLKHASSSSNNLVLASDGNVSITNTLSAGTIGNNVNVQGSFGVTDVTSKFDITSPFTAGGSYNVAWHFNGFVFVNFAIDCSTTSGSFKFMQINDSNFYPNNEYSHSSISYQQDSSNRVYVNTSGEFFVSHAFSPSGSDSVFRINVHLWYRTA